MQDDLIIEHYKRVKPIIQEKARDREYWRCGNGDFHRWYKREGDVCRLYDLQKDEDYEELIREHRSLYWSLNFFFDKVKTERIPVSLKDETGRKITIGHRRTTATYSLGIDIDSLGDIHENEVRKAVEDGAKFFIEKTKEFLPNSLHMCFSGGGIYIYIHHNCFKTPKNATEEELDWYWYVLQNEFNYYIKDVENEFFKAHPEHIGKVKFDALDNAKRVFKSLFSIHKKYDYAVIPLDINNIQINFEDAKIPLKDEIIEKGKRWYTTWDERPLAFYRRLDVYQKDVLEKYNVNVEPGEITIAETPISEECFPPCIKNILARREMGKGKTRAITLLATFLGQVGWSGDEACKIFEKKALELGAQMTNIFESWFRRMNCPSCATIQTTIGSGTSFPHMEMGELGVCIPDDFCKKKKIGTLYLYAKLKSELKEKKKKKPEEEKPEILSEDAEKRAEELIISPSLLYHICKTFETKHTGEHRQTMSLFLDMLACLTPFGGVALVDGETSVGKTHLTNTVADALPKTWIRKIGSMSPTTLAHMDEQELKNVKILYLQELGGAKEENVESFKLMGADDGGFWAEWVEGSPAIGFATVRKYIPIKYICTTFAKTEIDPELETRLLRISCDESWEQTKKVVDRRAAIWAGDYKEESFNWIKALVTKLESFDEIRIPFSYAVSKILGYEILRARRDIDKILKLIAMSAFLNQKRRPRIEEDNKKILFAVPEDAYNIFTLSLEWFEETVSGITKRDRAILDVLRDNMIVETTKHINEKTGEEIGYETETLMPMSYNEITKALVEKQKMFKSKKQIQRICEKLEGYGHILINKKGGPKGCDLICLTSVDERILKRSFEECKKEICEQMLLLRAKYPKLKIESSETCINPITGQTETVFPLENETGTCETSETPKKDEETTVLQSTMLQNSKKVSRSSSPTLNSENQTSSPTTKPNVSVVAPDEKNLLLDESRREHDVTKTTGTPGQILHAKAENNVLLLAKEQIINTTTPSFPLEKDNSVCNRERRGTQKISTGELDEKVKNKGETLTEGLATEIAQMSRNVSDVPLELVVVRILQNIPEFVNPNNPNETFSFSKEDVVSLEPNITEILIKKGIAEKIK